MKIEDLISILNIAESGPGYKGYETNDQFLRDSYQKYFGNEAIENAVGKNYFPKPYHTCWIDLIRKELSNTYFSEKSYLKYTSKIKSIPRRYYLMLDLIQHQLDNFSNVEFAKQTILELPDVGGENCQYRGWRIVLRFYAKTGNSKDFIRTLKLCNARKSPKNEIDFCKIELLKSVCDKHGYQAAKELNESTIMKNKYLHNILIHYGGSMSICEIDDFLESNHKLESTITFLRSSMYVESADKNLRHNFKRDIFMKIIDHLSTEARYKRDGYLYNLIGISDDRELNRICAQLIHTPRLRADVKHFI